MRFLEHLYIEVNNMRCSNCYQTMKTLYKNRGIFCEKCCIEKTEQRIKLFTFIRNTYLENPKKYSLKLTHDNEWILSKKDTPASDCRIFLDNEIIRTDKWGYFDEHNIDLKGK